MTNIRYGCAFGDVWVFIQIYSFRYSYRYILTDIFLQIYSYRYSYRYILTDILIRKAWETLLLELKVCSRRDIRFLTTVWLDQSKKWSLTDCCKNRACLPLRNHVHEFPFIHAHNPISHNIAWNSCLAPKSAEKCSRWLWPIVCLET